MKQFLLGIHQTENLLEKKENQALQVGAIDQLVRGKEI